MESRAGGYAAAASLSSTAITATDSVDWEYWLDINELVLKLKSEGFKTIAIEQVHGGQILSEFIPPKEEKYAIIFGNEVFGVNDEVIQQVDQCLEIPQFGTKHSVNVSVSVGIVLWDFYQKLILQ